MARKPDGPLRRGWTTGACATAATKAAYTALLTGAFPDPVSITLPKGEQPSFALSRESLSDGAATAAIVKDAGDDPDVTHLATISVTVRPGAKGSGVTFRAGEGVGTVTKAGLPIPPGEPAINPVPRDLMRGVVAEVAAAHDGSGDVEIEISVPGGEALARKTWNPRLGIVGGLSILGTTGVVVPFSCSAWIHSIHRGIDVARAEGFPLIAACTGSTSEAAVAKRHGLPETAFIDMGDFAGGMLKYLRRHPVPKLIIGGGFAKLAKLAEGHMDLHSGRSQIDMDWLAARLGEVGGAESQVRAAREANTGLEVLNIAKAANLLLGDRIATLAREEALQVLDGAGTEVIVEVFDREGTLVGSAGEV
ncbi:MAG: cobalt-precorrin-5B (C(1))-methyltransferase [Nisaea sp.]|uniref:cobalt-precorrin-5B (C(1))-methyltransferase n=1 Tax=Nisaea sp. TaxID=2024842 RepID=UPI001B2C974E|nr:cobalt-precorrin-5B (C(1))-methyltransferase [Nisaea sp.]MBO6561334.1 cobalt-precorrin-5B (C(1))-methyltransferase [Nisaea sp.]